jgi:hypothetical protein
MIPIFRTLRVLTTLLFIHTVVGSQSNLERRSRHRARSHDTPNVRSLVTRAAPSGWALHVKSGNDGGGCYIDSQTRVLTGYTESSWTNSLDSCLNTCRTKGFAFGGVEAGNECFVSRIPPWRQY